MSTPYYRNLGGKPAIRATQEQTRVVSGPYITVSTSFLYHFEEHTFTNCGQTGYTGPTLTMCKDAYTSQPWVANSSFFNMTTQGIQEWTVPATGIYRVEVWGAAGGTHVHSGNTGGQGAVIIGQFNLTKLQIISLLVGQLGKNSVSVSGAAPGGGGGTFIWRKQDNNLLIAAGGGAGGSRNNYTNRHASTSENGQSAEGKSNGGVSGNGGRSNAGGSSYWAGGGAGWNTNGTGGNNATDYNYVPGSQGAEGGRRALEGGFGGIRWNDGNDEGGDGSFGGGGGGGSDTMGTGGGGGYSGGGGGNSNPGNGSGGGGGSYYRNATNVSTSVSNTGHGKVVVTRVG